MKTPKLIYLDTEIAEFVAKQEPSASGFINEMLWNIYTGQKKKYETTTDMLKMMAATEEEFSRQMDQARVEIAKAQAEAQEEKEEQEKEATELKEREQKLLSHLPQRIGLLITMIETGKYRKLDVTEYEKKLEAIKLEYGKRTLKIIEQERKKVMESMKKYKEKKKGADMEKEKAKWASRPSLNT